MLYWLHILNSVRFERSWRINEPFATHNIWSVTAALSNNWLVLFRIFVFSSFYCASWSPVRDGLQCCLNCLALIVTMKSSWEHVMKTDVWSKLLQILVNVGLWNSFLDGCFVSDFRACEIWWQDMIWPFWVKICHSVLCQLHCTFCFSKSVLVNWVTMEKKLLITGSQVLSSRYFSCNYV